MELTIADLDIKRNICRIRIALEKIAATSDRKGKKNKKRIHAMKPADAKPETLN